MRMLPCFHAFHADCVDPWLLSAGTCPCCKHRPDADLGDLDLADLGGDLGDLGPGDHDLGEDPGQGSPGSPESAQSAHAHQDHEEY